MPGRWFSSVPPLGGRYRSPEARGRGVSVCSLGIAPTPPQFTNGMDTETIEVLEAGGICDITTTGAKSGEPRRIEIVFHQFDGEYFITGKPGFKRDWLANLIENPAFTLHLKRGLEADLSAKAEPISDPATREAVLFRILTESWDNEPSKAQHILPRWVEEAPLVKFQVESN